MDCQRIQKIRRRDIDTEQGEGRRELSLSFISEFEQQKERTTLQEHLVVRAHSAAHAESDYIKLPAAGGPRRYTLIDINIYERGEKRGRG